ncbi:hypothetical protein C9374_010207 [Naegleria lovaniensis]|uniref:Transmembrane protein n=1 Tax=Naegleria lovaniensis TaxID=51637 RepID=A0AA88GGY2_NAELO|nr:uncharacterized protein C9374_011571 [Naegleria lovaniensis]XP_044544377.1 uncharacterized protein C9374_010207 [Naegleria lovaniensis]KAG2373906.1 hypothetical protein C9374_011571 [Naegleria lovaniensis]KAG2375203.1 hypothetical protein C9374_010207 [Naegleria lovaniensis]
MKKLIHCETKSIADKRRALMVLAKHPLPHTTINILLAKNNVVMGRVHNNENNIRTFRANSTNFLLTTSLANPKPNQNSTHPFANSLPKLYYLFLIGGGIVLVANFIGIIYYKKQFNELMKQNFLISNDEEHQSSQTLDSTQIQKLKELITSVRSLIRVGYYPKEFYETKILHDIQSLKGKQLTDDPHDQETLQQMIEMFLVDLKKCSSQPLRSQLAQSAPHDDELTQWLEKPKETSAGDKTSLKDLYTSKVMSFPTLYKVFCFTTIGSLAFARLNRIPAISQKSRMAITSIVIMYSAWAGLFRHYSITKLSNMFTSWFETSNSEGQPTIRLPIVHLIFQQYLNVFAFIIWLSMYRLVRYVVLPEVLFAFDREIIQLLEDQSLKESKNSEKPQHSKED